MIARWYTYPALRSERAQQIFKRLCPEILGRLSRVANPDEALLAFDGFLRGLPAGVQVFSLFEANPQLIDLLVDIVGTAPALAQYLSRNADVFDAVIAGDFFADWPGRAALEADLAARLAAQADYERALDAARRWHKEWHFRVGVHHLRGLVAAETAAAQYADLAAATIAALWPLVVDQFAARHGAPPGRGAAVLGMGSLGAGRLNARSDLDLIVIYDPEDAEGSDGKRPLSVRPYYARLTQAMITALTAPMAEGRLYEVDMRLRPSGNQGPVATSWPAFCAYQRDEAWTWEHLALTRARAIAGEPGLGRDIETFRAGLIADRAERAPVLRAVAEMRARLAGAKPPDGPWDVKLGPGRLLDLELVGQAGTLIAGQAARDVAAGLGACVASGLTDAAGGAALEAAHAICWRVQMVARLLGEGPLVPDRLGEGGTALLLRETGARASRRWRHASRSAPRRPPGSSTRCWRRKERADHGTRGCARPAGAHRRGLQDRRDRAGRMPLGLSRLGALGARRAGHAGRSRGAARAPRPRSSRPPDDGRPARGAGTGCCAAPPGRVAQPAAALSRRAAPDSPLSGGAETA